jgi:hypothetical protein
VEDEIVDVIEYVNYGKILRPEIWTCGNNIINHYRWSIKAKEILFGFVKDIVIRDFGGFEHMEWNENSRIKRKRVRENE